MNARMVTSKLFFICALVVLISSCAHNSAHERRFASTSFDPHEMRPLGMADRD